MKIYYLGIYNYMVTPRRSYGDTKNTNKIIPDWPH